MKCGRTVTVACILLVMSLLCGCQTMTASGVSGSQIMSGTQAAVLPFENLSGDVNAGLVVSDSLATSLLQKDRSCILPPDRVRQTLSSYEGQYLPPEQLGKLLGVDVVITGTVKEYRYVYGAGEQPVISFSVRIISTAKGAVLWTRDYTASGKFTLLNQASLGDVTQQMCQRAAADLQANVTKR